MRQGDLAMRAKRIQVAYFSPTGGTERAARMLAELFGLPVEMHDRTLPEGRKQVITCEPGDVCIIACPVYAGGIPDVPGLFENIQGDGTPCVLLATYGNRHYDNALAKLKERMGTVGFLTIGAMAAVIPHVFSDQLGAGRPNDEDRSHMVDFAMEILQKVNNWDVECPVIPGDASAPAKRMAYLPKTLDRERCTGCGTCARECPAGAIDAKTQTIDEVKCINCLRCVKKGCGAWSCDYSAITARLEAHYSAPRLLEVFL